VRTLVDTLSYPPPYLRRYRSELLVQRVNEALAEGADWLVCDTQLSGQIVFSKELRPIKRALGLYDVYDRMLRRTFALAHVGAYKAKFFLDWQSGRAYEKRLMTRFDLITLVSPEDQAWAQAKAPGRSTLLVPNGVDLDHFRPPESSPDGQPRLLFVGTLAYGANTDALHYFLDGIWPSVRRARPEARFTIIGTGAPDWLKARILSEQGVQLEENVDDLRPYYRGATVAVVPIRLGGGTKLKVLEALACGVPVVTTPAGSEGLKVRDGTHALVRESAADFADAISQILKSPDLGHTLAEAGRQLVEECYGWSTIMDRYEQILRERMG